MFRIYFDNVPITILPCARCACEIRDMPTDKTGGLRYGRDYVTSGNLSLRKLPGSEWNNLVEETRRSRFNYVRGADYRVAKRRWSLPN